MLGMFSASPSRIEPMRSSRFRLTPIPRVYGYVSPYAPTLHVISLFTSSRMQSLSIALKVHPSHACPLFRLGLLGRIALFVLFTPNRILNTPNHRPQNRNASPLSLTLPILNNLQRRQINVNRPLLNGLCLAPIGLRHTASSER